MKFTSEELEKATGTVFDIKGSFEISTDTRTIKNGDFYLPLKGANFNGENFCENALKAGASGCFYSENPCKNGVKVNDTLEAYLQIANFARRKYNPKVIGVTGSSGKTSTSSCASASLQTTREMPTLAGESVPAPASLREECTL